MSKYLWGLESEQTPSISRLKTKKVFSTNSRVGDDNNESINVSFAAESDKALMLR